MLHHHIIYFFLFQIFILAFESALFYDHAHVGLPGLPNMHMHIVVIYVFSSKALF